MRVTSGIADVDFSVHTISRQGPYLVVRNQDDRSLPTVVYVSAQDIVAALKALFASPAALGFVLTAPFRRKSLAAGSVGNAIARDDVNNPWL
ncbi:MAG: hypothetical protein ACREVV_05565 [Steroidobacteraceae bacterium]